MTVARGTTAYAHEIASCSAVGVEWNAADLESAMNPRIVDIVFDQEGVADVKNMLLSVADTDFELQQLRHILTSSRPLPNWRVGEAIAEVYLTDHYGCLFPWPDGRDERTRGSSLPGADLVGFTRDTQGTCFAFGEVKTSGEDKYPPTSVYGRSGLRQQLEALRDNQSIRDDLLLYLAFRAGTASWRGDFVAASKRYLTDTTDVVLYGVLIRDVSPNIGDIKDRLINLAVDIPAATRLYILVLYLPLNTIDYLSESAIAYRSEA